MSEPSSESLLRESEERYRALFDNASDMIQSVRPDGTFEFVNRAWHETLGYTDADLTTLIVWDLIDPELLNECMGHFMVVMEGGALTDYRTSFLSRDGRKIPVEGSVQGRWVDDTIVATHGFFRDISERLRSEELEARNAQLELERQARFLEKMAALGKLSAGLSHELNNPAAAAQRSAQRINERLSRRDAAIHALVEANIGAVAWSAMEDLVVQCVTPPTSVPSPYAVSRLEAEIEEWLEDHGVDEAWTWSGALAQGDITPPALDELRRILPPGAIVPAIAWIGETIAVRDDADIIGRSTDRISQLVGAVKSYSFRDQAIEQDVDLHDGIENTLVILGYRLRTMSIERHYDANLPPVRTYGSSLNQVWTNILDNAVDATGGVGNIEIRTHHEADMAVVEISDNGSGIAPEEVSRIFEPFYTTKPQGEGTGLGLDIAWRIVTEEHRGSIAVESRPGHTTFRVTIPICPDLTQAA